MYNLRKIAQNTNEQLRDFIVKNNDSIFDNSNQNIFEWVLNNDEINVQSLDVYTKQKILDIATNNQIDIIIEILNDVILNHKAINFKDDNIYLKSYDRIMSTFSFSLFHAVCYDEKLPILLPEKYLELVVKGAKKELLDRIAHGVSSNEIFKKLSTIKFSNNESENLYFIVTYLFDNIDTNIYNVFSNISMVIKNNMMIKNNFLQFFKEYVGKDYFYKKLRLLSCVPFFQSVITHDDFVDIFNSFLKQMPKLARVCFELSNYLKNNAFLQYHLNEDVYNLLKENGMLCCLSDYIGDPEFIKKYPFINEKEVVVSNYINKKLSFVTIDQLLKYFDNIYQVIENTNDINSLKNIIYQLTDSKIYLYKKNVNYRYRNNSKIFNHFADINYFSNLINDKFINIPADEFTSKYNNYMITIQNKLDFLISKAKDVCKSAINNPNQHESILKLRNDGFIELDKKDRKKIIIESCKKVINNMKKDEHAFESVYNLLGNFIYSWGNTRMFGMGQNEHDTWMLFSENLIEQPMITSFLQKELNSSYSQIVKLLSIRYEAIKNNAILPGKERPEELQGKYYPDNRKGLMAYESKQQIKDLPDDKTEFYSNLSNFYSTADINKFFSKLKIPTKKYLLPDETNINGFTFKILDKNDPLGSILGNLTSCCQILNGAGERCVYDGYNNPKSGFLAVFKGKTLIAQSWLRIGRSKTLYLDNIETISSFDENYNKKNSLSLKEFSEINIDFDNFKINKSVNDGPNPQQMLREAFIEWAKYIKTKQNKNGEPLFIGVVAGSGYADVTFPDNVLQKRINHQEEFGARANIYTDLSEIGNYKLAFNLKRRYIGGEKKYV